MGARKFPASIAKVLDLARDMSAGFETNPGVYPAPPVNGADLEILITTYMEKRDAVVDIRAQLNQAQEAKEEAREALEADMKRDLRYAENTVHYDDGKLQLIGWSGRHPATALPSPGQVRELTSPDRGDGWIELTWKAPEDGGKVTAYQVLRRTLGEETWTLAAMALEPEARVENQEQGKKFEFCVVAVNKAGDGLESNIVTAGV